MNNIPILALNIKKQIENFLMTEGKDDVPGLEKEKMYEELKIACDSIQKYLDTQQMENRKFEQGKMYYDNDYCLRTVEKLTPKGVWFSDSYGASRIQEDINNKEYVLGVYKVKA